MVSRQRWGIPLVLLGASLSRCALPPRPTLLDDEREASSPESGVPGDASLEGAMTEAARNADDERDASIMSPPDVDAAPGDGPADRSPDADSGAAPDAPPTDGGGEGADGGADAPREVGLPDGSPPCVVSISAGMWHTCALLRDGVHCWGHDSEGELGDGQDPSDSRPGVSATPVLRDVKAVSAGGMHSCALTTAGGVRCWGFNNAGQLGFAQADAAVPLLSPPSVDAIANVKAIAAGYDNTCALTVPGGVRCWGSNADGKLGIGSSSILTLSTPPSADVIGGVKAVSAGYGHTCALTTSGGVRCWGQNQTGQLGLGSLDPLLSPPANDVLTGAGAIAAGYGHTCAVMTGGGVRCWGFNMNGQLGDGTTNDRSAPPSTTVTLAGVPVATVGTGYAHTCALTTAGAVYCWGSNAEGQIGEDINTVYQEQTPTLVSVGAAASALTVGDSYNCAVTVAGSVLCWGTNNNGQFGDGAIAVMRSVPTLAASLEAVCQP